MIQDVYVKLNPGLPLQKQHSTRRPLSSANGLKFKEETSKVLCLEYSFQWCWKLDTSESRSALKVLKRGDGKGWIDHVRNEEVLPW